MCDWRVWPFPSSPERSKIPQPPPKVFCSLPKWSPMLSRLRYYLVFSGCKMYSGSMVWAGPCTAFTICIQIKQEAKKDSPLTQFTLFSIAQSQWPDAYKSWSCKLSSPGGAAGPGSVLNCLENPLPAQVYLAWWAHALTECHTFIPASSKNLHSPRGPAILKHLKCICIEFILSTFTSREPVSNLLCFLCRNTRKSPASIVSLMHNNPSGQAQLGGSCSQDKAELQQGHLKVCVYRVSIGACRCWLHHLSIQLLVLQF